MEIMETRSQGYLTVVDHESGRSYVVPQGASEDVGEGTTDDSTVSGVVDQGVQSDSGAGESQQGESGQGFLEPYLKDLPEDQRGIVEPILERYRQEQDANVNRRFSQLQEETRTATMLHQALVEDPLRTLDWIADRLKEERGLDARAELLRMWNQAQQEIQESPESDENKPLTQADIDRILQEREEQRIQQERQLQFERQQAQKMQATVNGWIDTAAKTFNLPLDDSNDEDPIRAVIIMEANKLHENNVATGQAAIEMATEAIAKRLRATSNGSSGESQHPKVASGGTAPPAKEIDVTNRAERRARMLELLTPPPTH